MKNSRNTVINETIPNLLENNDNIENKRKHKNDIYFASIAGIVTLVTLIIYLFDWNKSLSLLFNSLSYYLTSPFLSHLGFFSTPLFAISILIYTFTFKTRLLVLSFVSIAVGVLLYLSLKVFLDINSPFIVLDNKEFNFLATSKDSLSAPSLNAFIAFSLYGIIFYNTKIKNRFIFIILALLTSLVSVISGKVWLLDIFYGMLLGICISYICYILYNNFIFEVNDKVMLFFPFLNIILGILILFYSPAVKLDSIYLFKYFYSLFIIIHAIFSIRFAFKHIII